MKSFATIAVALSAIGFVAAAPTKTIEERSTSICGQWDSITTGGYTLYQDLWNKAAATSGSQCTILDSISGSTIKWHSNWNWLGGQGQVKSYPNVVANIGTSKKLSAFSSLKTTWDWGYSGSNIVADVSYDIFLSTTTSSSGDKYEIMIWLAALGGAGPISSTGSTIATPTIAGHSWKLYSGPNGATTVYSFVASSEITSFSGDLLDFLKYLETNQGVSSSLYLNSIGAGTEPFSGTGAQFKSRSYSLVAA